MYIPDLFGAYIKGRELAIEKNWQDLKNYEQVEQMRTNNNLQELDLLGRRADFAGNRSMFYDRVKASSQAAEVGDYEQPGRVARARLGSDASVVQYGVYKENEPWYSKVLGKNFKAKLAEQDNSAEYSLGKSTYLAPRAYELGGLDGETGANQIVANNILGDYKPTAARQTVALENQSFNNNYKEGELLGTQLGYAIETAPIIHANNVDALGRVIPGRNKTQEYIDSANSGGVDLEYVASLISRAKANDEGAVFLLKHMGLDSNGNPLSQGQTAQGQTRPDNALPSGTTPNGMPVQQFNAIGNTVGATTQQPVRQTRQPVQQTQQPAQSEQPQMYYHPTLGWVTY